MIESANTGRPQKPLGGAVEINGQMLFDSAELDRCARLKKEFAAFVRGEIAGKALHALREDACQMAMIPTPNGAYRIFQMGLSAVLAHGLVLLHDEPGLGADVKQCQLPTCGKFFLASDQVDPSSKGRRPYRYCCEAHMKQGQTSGAERTRRWREKQAAKHK